MKGFRNILFLAILGFAMASCVTSRKVNYMQEPDKTIPHYADTLDFEEYQLRPNDRLYVYVYSLDEHVMSMYNAGGASASQMRSQMQMGMGGRNSNELYTYLINEDGDIDFPTLGKLHVAGLTTRETKHLLEEELSSLLKELPGYKTVSVEVTIMNRTFSIVGVKSGMYSINKEKMTIFEAIAMAGNIQEFGDRSCIKIVREKDGQTTIKTFDIRSKDIINSEFYYVEPNDIIYIREITGKSFGINSAAAGLAVVSSTLSFGVFVYSIVQLGIRLAK